MEGSELFVWVREFAVIIVGIFGGAATVPLVRWLKDVLNTEGKTTLVLVAFVSAILAIAGMIADGAISPDVIRVENLSMLVMTIFVASQVIYNEVKDQAEDES